MMSCRSDSISSLSAMRMNSGSSAIVSMGIIVIQWDGSTSHYAQFTRFCLGIKHNLGLLKNPCLNLFVVHAQQVQRPDGVVLFSRCTGFESHQLRHHASGYL